MRVVVFTAIMVDPNRLGPPIDIPEQFTKIPQFDYILFTNTPNHFKNTSWTIKHVDPPTDEIPKDHFAIYANRYYKWRPHVLFKDTYDVAIYVDGWQIPNPKHQDVWCKYARQVMDPSNPICIIQCPHPVNQCIYNELTSIVNARKDTFEKMAGLRMYLQSQNFPTNQGLFWNGCYLFAVKKQNKKLQQVMQDLWNDMILYTYRDQSMYMYHLWKNNAMYLVGKAHDLEDIVSTVDPTANLNHNYT